MCVCVCVCVCVCFCERVGESGVEDSRRQLGIKATDVNLSSVPSRQGKKYPPALIVNGFLRVLLPLHFS